MSDEANLKRLLRRAICEFIEPVGISHVSKDTQWRADADAFIKECAPLVFGKDETVFGLKRTNEGHNPGPYVDDDRVREIIGDSSIEPEKRMLAQHTIDGRAANGLLELHCDELEREVQERSVPEARFATLAGKSGVAAGSQRTASRLLETKREGQSERMTHGDIETACKNIGYDLTCSACAERFFTGGSWGAEHDETCATLATLKSTTRITITNVELPSKANQ